MNEFLPNLIVIALVCVAGSLFLQRGWSRRDLLFMGLAAYGAAIWMAAVTMIDYGIHSGQVPVLWLHVSMDALLASLFFVYVAVIMLENYYSAEERIVGASWLPLALVLTGLYAAHTLEPQLFYSDVRLVEPSADRLRLDPQPKLKYSLGIGYYFFLLVAAYVAYGIAKRFPKVVQAMELPEAERRTRVLISVGVLAAFWFAAFDIVPAFGSSTTPSFMRLIGPALWIGGAVYAMVLARALDIRLTVRSGLFYVIRLLLIALPVVVLASAYRDFWVNWSPRQTAAGFLGLVAVIDFAAVRLKPWLDRLAQRKTYNSAEAVNAYVHEMLLLKGLRDFSNKVTAFLSSTLGVGDVSVWVPPLDNPKAFHTIEGKELWEPSESVRTALIERNQSTTQEDLQLDPRVYEDRDALVRSFSELRAEVVIPLVDDGKLAGLITLGSKESFDEYFEQDLEFLDRLKSPTALALLNAFQYEVARTGKPVRVLSRIELEEQLGRQWSQARRYQEALSIALFRLDDPRAFEAAHGPASAMRFVSELAERLRPTLRARDIPATYDDHTIALFMPNTPTAGAEIAGRRIRSWLEACTISLGDVEVQGGFVLGIASRHDDMEAASELLEAAESALEDSTAVAGR